MTPLVFALALATPEENAESGTMSWGSDVVVNIHEVVDDALAVGGDLEVHGTVLGDATAIGGDVVVFPTAHVNGSVVAIGGSVSVHPGGKVDGDRVDLELPAAVAGGPQGLGAIANADGVMNFARGVINRVLAAASFAALGVLVVALFPQRIVLIGKQLVRRPVDSTVTGAIIGSMWGLFGLLFLLITLGLGTPLSLLVWVALGAAWLLGGVALCTVVGDRLRGQPDHPATWRSFLLGAAIVTAATAVPLIGTLAWLLGSAAAVGAFIGSRAGTNA